MNRQLGNRNGETMCRYSSITKITLRTGSVRTL
jgi:hypothetical protein